MRLLSFRRAPIGRFPIRMRSAMRRRRMRLPPKRARFGEIRIQAPPLPPGARSDVETQSSYSMTVQEISSSVPGVRVDAVWAGSPGAGMRRPASVIPIRAGSRIDAGDLVIARLYNARPHTVTAMALIRGHLG
jgi:hypothetical protein